MGAGLRERRPGAEQWLFAWAADRASDLWPVQHNELSPRGLAGRTVSGNTRIRVGGGAGKLSTLLPLQ